MAIDPREIAEMLLATNTDPIAVAVDGVIVGRSPVFLTFCDHDPVGRRYEELVTDDSRVVTTRGASKVTVQRTSFGGHSVIVIHATDELTSASKESEELYRALFEVNTAMKLLIDASTGMIVHANEPACAFYGWSRDEMRGMYMWDINLAGEAAVKAAMSRADTQRQTQFRFKHKLRNGELRAVDVYSGPISWRGHVYLMSIIHDVTERDRLEDQLRDAQRLEALGRLAGGVAHDFANLLTVILGRGEALAAQVDPGKRPAVEAIVDAATRARRLVRQLLAYGRREVLEPRPMDLGEVVRSVITLIEPLKGRAHLVVDADRPVPPILADPSAVEQVVLNLVLNARDALRDDGGTVWIGVHCRTAAEDQVPKLAAGMYAVLEVRDDGVGMDETTQSRVFEPFFTTRPDEAGRGLGLATVEGLVHQHGGAIRLQSALALGSTFTVWWPIAHDPVRRSATPAPAPRSSSGTVLVVEDQEEVRQFLEFALGRAGWTVIVAAGAAEALRVERPFDVLVTDVMMPGKSGLVLLEELRERVPGLPTVLVSGFSPELAAEGQKFDAATVFLAKPFTGKDLIDAVERAQRKARG